ncbi:MAG: TetR/AcrR family transcriptional regulator, partial [Pseudomonadales bacterium]
MGLAERHTKAQLTLIRILDAALECYTANGIAQTTLEEVAKVAGVGRTTLYRYVDNRDDLLSKVVLRDARQQQEEMKVVTRYHDNLADSLVDSILYIMRGRRTRPMNILLFGKGGDAVIDRINLSPANFYTMAQKMLEPLFTRACEQGQIRDGVTLTLVSQWVARLILSLITYPEEFLEDEKALRAFLEA